MAPKGNKNAVGNKGGAPSKYTPEAHRIAVEAVRGLGATIDQVAKLIGVSEHTVDEWKKAHPEFRTAMQEARDEWDTDLVEKSLLSRAMGYSHKATKMFMHKGEILKEEYIEHYPPDTQALALWLHNRRSPRWKQKQEIEHSGGVSVTFNTPIASNAPDENKD